MQIKRLAPTRILRFSLILALSLLGSIAARGQCSQVISGLQFPLGITQSNQDNLLIGESGLITPNTGRISIVDPDGNRKTLIDGLPSGRNDVGDPSGPAGLFIRGRTLYVVIGVGNSVLAGPFPGSNIPNPNPSSQLFSSVLAIHFSAAVERNTSGFTLTLADQSVLATGEKVTLSNSADESITVQLIANFPDYTPNPLPTFPPNVRASNPFDLVVVDNQVYVTDGGMNILRQVDIPSGTFSTLASFPSVPNPFFPAVGGPVIEAVPTGIRYVNGQLLVNLFSGVPFPPARYGSWLPPMSRPLLTAWQPPRR